MPSIPAYCESCGLVFPAGISLGENIRDVRISNTTSACPRCGGRARIPDGIYNVLGQTVVLLAKSKRSARQLEKLLDELNRAQDRHASPQEIKQTIKQYAPELKRIADWIPQTPSQALATIEAICAVLSVLIASAALYIAIQQAATPQMVEEAVLRALSKIEKASPERSPEREVIVVNIPQPQKDRKPASKRKRKPKTRVRRTSGR